jgi:predicted Zn-dependent peptidase
MLTTLLSGGESSRFSREIKDKQQKVVAVGAFPFALEDPGLFLTFGIANMGVKPEEVENAMDEEVAKVQKDLISEAEFQKLRNQIENEFVSGNATVAGIAENLANYEMYFGDANLINTELERYMKVTREDIQRVAQKYLTKNNRVVLHYMPKAAQPTGQAQPEPGVQAAQPAQPQTPAAPAEAAPAPPAEKGRKKKKKQ